MNCDPFTLIGMSELNNASKATIAGIAMAHHSFSLCTVNVGKKADAGKGHALARIRQTHLR